MLKEVFQSVRLPYIRAMAWSKKTAGVILALMIVSLAGLVVLQTSLLSNAWELKEAAFRRNVLRALGAAADRLETQETSIMAYRTAGVTDTAVQIGVHMFGPDSVAGTNLWSRARMDSTVPSVRLEDDSLILNVPTPQRVIVQFFDSLGLLDTTVIDTTGLLGEHSVSLDREVTSRNLRVVKSINDTATLLMCLEAS